jgi:Uma2 family endonuclease
MVDIAPTITDAELIRLSCQNPELRFERDADGTLVTMPPIGSISANREVKAITRLAIWVEQNQLGEVFSSSGGFKLANSAVRSPDAAFVAKERLPSGWREREDEFLDLAPDFVIEIRSKTDSLPKLKRKMEEYRENGVKLGWLIDSHNKQAFVYRQDGTITCYPANAILSGEDVVPGFTLALEILL